MFIRWQKRPKSVRSRQDIILMAVLIRSIRIDGRPRQQHMAYLGSISESGLTLLGRRSDFWNSATEALNGLGDQITRVERKSIEKALRSKVGPRPTQREKQAAHRLHKAALSRLQRSW
jgi:hypothetical protein